MKQTCFLLMIGLLVAGCTTAPVKDTGGTSLNLVNPTLIPSVAVSTPTPTAEASSSALLKSKEKVMNTAVIATSKGTFTVKLYPDSAPKTVANFEAKAKSDYYKNLIFHRVEDWVVQGGDPLGTGTGGGDMPTELSQVPFKEGSVGVARAGDIKVSNDSQFFVCKTDCGFLTGQYTNFGEVTSGMDVVKQIQIGDKIMKISIE